ncbi:MAG: response regulator [Candidatus Omnitrophota bacterium]|nr:response regulator [Candidatus Omnitrophota bacterium]
MAKKKILVVDDEVNILEIARYRLVANNYDVITASNGREALEKVKKEKPDAVLLDVMMPEIDGLSVLKQIRNMDADLPVFMFTAFSNEERFKLANNLNVSGFILKTADLQNEIKNITNVLEARDRITKKNKESS